jgi:hypothetical protein
MRSSGIRAFDAKSLNVDRDFPVNGAAEAVAAGPSAQCALGFRELADGRKLTLTLAVKSAANGGESAGLGMSER